MRVEEATEFDGDIEFNARAWESIAAYFRSLWSYFPLLVALCVVFFIGAVTMYVAVPPVYTATATVGPPNPSPTSGLLAGINGSSVFGGLASRLARGAGAAAGGGDPFQEYRQLLNSTRLANALAVQDAIMPRIFYRDWDSENRRWKERGALSAITWPIKRLLQRPIEDHPGIDDLNKYFSKHLGIAAVQTAAEKSSLVSSGPGYISVSLDGRSPGEAESLLNIILARADQIVRQEQMRDVLARIAYISKELPRITQSEQREALIQTLSDQENLRIMLVSDKRFASLLIDPPHAPQKPSWPPAPVLGFPLAALFAILAWFVIVWIADRSERVRRTIRGFRRG